MNNNYKNNLINERDAGIGFTLSAIFPYFTVLVATLICGFISQNYQEKYWFTYVSMFATQLANFIVLAYFVRSKKQKPCKLYLINRFNVKYLALAFLLAIGLLIGVGYFNELFVNFLSDVGLNYSSLSVPLANVYQMLLSVIFIALLPAVFEELIFRGLILGGTAKFKVWQMVLINGLLFSLFHQNPAQTIYQFITGCVFALIVIKSGSVLPSIIMHFFNNALIIILSYIAPNLNIFNVYTVVIGLILFFGVTAYLIFIDRNEKKQTVADKKIFWLASIFGIVFCVVMWVVTLIL